MFDTKVALIVRDDLAAWQKLNVVAFRDGRRGRSARSARRALRGCGGTPLRPHAGPADAGVLGRPERPAGRAPAGAVARATIVPYVHAMFSTGHDAANRDVFRAGDAENLDFVGLALRGPKKAVDKAVKGLALHA